MLLIFGGETLQDFAFAMMVGIASGTYSSIFIASPVLTAWKEREPAYRRRRERIEEQMGHVPAFPEENVIARVEGGPRGWRSAGGARASRARAGARAGAAGSRSQPLERARRPAGAAQPGPAAGPRGGAAEAARARRRWGTASRR